MTSEAGMTDPTNGAVSYRQLLHIEGFPQLAAATLLARTGGQLWEVALVLVVLQRFHSPVLAGFAAFLAVAPGLVASPLMGALLDRYGCLRLIQLDLGIAATALALLAALAAANALTPAILLLIVTLSSLTNPLTVCGTRTLYPLVTPRALWDRANGVDSGSMALATVVGPALAGVSVAWLGGEGAFLLAASAFVLAGVVLLGVQEPTPEPRAMEPLARAAWTSLLYVVRDPTQRGIILTLGIANIPLGILIVALPVIVLQEFQWGAGVVGLLWACAGMATVIAGPLAGRLDTEGRERPTIVAGLTLGALGCLCLLLSLPRHWTLALVVGMALFGLASGPIDIGLFALRQRRTDMRWFARVVAISMSLNFVGMPIGSALAGPIVERSTSLALLVATGSLAIGCIVPLRAIPRTG
jgi:MFS family permease